MNYEEFYSEALKIEKAISDVMRAQQKQYKAACKNLEDGDLKNAVKNLAPVTGLCNEAKEKFADMQALVEGFNSREYVESGEFAQQLLEYCREEKIDVKGEGMSYEVYPYKVRIDPDALEVFVDRKKLQCMRPLSLVNIIKAGRDKLFKASFNAAAFAKELADAYDLALLKQSKGKTYIPNKVFSLVSLYTFLTPMKRFRKEYDRQSYAFDLARLRFSGLVEIEGGRRIDWGPGRDISNSIRILDESGNEEFLSTIKFY